MVEHRRKAEWDKLETAKRQDAARNLMDIYAYDKRLKGMAEHPKLLEVVRRLIYGQPTMLGEMALCKPPRIGREKLFG